LKQERGALSFRDEVRQAASARQSQEFGLHSSQVPSTAGDASSGTQELTVDDALEAGCRRKSTIDPGQYLSFSQKETQPCKDS